MPLISKAPLVGELVQTDEAAGDIVQVVRVAPA